MTKTQQENIIESALGTWVNVLALVCSQLEKRAEKYYIGVKTPKLISLSGAYKKAKILLNSQDWIRIEEFNELRRIARELDNTEEAEFFVKWCENECG